ncbi:ABC transporter ATP-binding protein [Mangrovibrevibacter kandeliae]|uniref:ABC transporter ATP-binding protein n=1 Tax=Mangrovibrevibacter kandeliae TaxID=2968473 RepID=UPI00211933CB|nr:ABC transporter ATP-binding protein [Aurantimonas sp. CSK15Z-1]MCQ8783488.1 ABC transporter ATP-binding protein [Aurantimonas sp. CSK15Z-1]
MRIATSRVAETGPAAAGPVPIPPVAAPLIGIRDLSKTYRTKAGETPTLSSVSLDVRAGEFVAVVGPSGCGKSTLMKLVAGLIPATSGEISIEGRPVREPPDDVGIVFQSPVLLAWRSVLGNVMLPVDVRRLDRARYRERALQLLETAGLKGFETRYPWQLSGGMQQRAAICRALVHDPAILLMDEPFGALDAMTREHMNVELQRIHGATGKTILFITHSIPEAVFLADRVVVMSPRPGRIEAVYDVELPRPRDLEMMGERGFIALVKRIRGHFAAIGALD